MSPPELTNPVKPAKADRKHNGELVREMEDQGLTNVGLRHADLPGDQKAIVGRTNCDSCYLGTPASGFSNAPEGCIAVALPKSPKQRSDTYSCAHCIKQGLPCSWTPMTWNRAEMLKWFNGERAHPTDPEVANIIKNVARLPKAYGSTVSSETMVQANESEDGAEDLSDKEKKNAEEEAYKAAAQAYEDKKE